MNINEAYPTTSSNLLLMFEEMLKGFELGLKNGLEPKLHCKTTQVDDYVFPCP